MPELEPAFLALGTTIVNTGMLVARQCDKLVHSRFPAYPPNKLYNIIKSSRINKARMLHYYAPDASEVSSNVSADDASVSSSSSDATTDASSPSENDFSDWCGWHNDHGSLTGLACSMYIDADGNEISNPDPQAGLHIRSRSGEIIQATFPADHLAFQMGETQHVHSGGVLQATPHAVRASSVPGVTRETMAVFMEPEYEELMNLPEGANTDDVVVALANEHLPKGVPSLASRWKDSKQTFGDYHYTTIDAYYKQ